MAQFFWKSTFTCFILSILPFRAFVQNIPFESGNLPLFLIDTKGQSIQDDPKIIAELKIIDQGQGKRNTLNDPPAYQGKIGIEYRGKFSQMLPQKPYGFETLDSMGKEINVSLLGFPKENDWILLANYNDKSFVRNSMIFSVFSKMGHYAPRAKHCEVFINQQYQGIYVFTEKIKRDKNRVDIPKMDLDDNAGDSITGGYIFKIDYSEGDDYWTSNYYPAGYRRNSVRFIYTYPAWDEITNPQKNYLKNHIDRFEDALYDNRYRDEATGYRKYIDLLSFVDYFIIGELTRNVDAYKKSCHYSKQADSEGGLIYAGPVWDFDWAMKNFNECIYRNTDGSGWAWKIHECSPSPVPPDWIKRMMTDPVFVNKIYDRYFSLRNSLLSGSFLFSYIDSVSALLDEAQQRHYRKWPILGKNVGTYEVDAIPDTFEGEIEKLKDWFALRLAWLDANMPGEPSESDLFCSSERSVRVFPNPFSNQLTVQSDKGIRSLEILSMDGNVIGFFPCNSNVWSESLSFLPKGIYFVRTTSSLQETTYLKILKNN
ncbi:MAG TPA: CotH kinase family protein [Prolixibacteraceae bacterium]|nr:CotH kinase family protein [Prolixibacteraceae bacterium]